MASVPDCFTLMPLWGLGETLGGYDLALTLTAPLLLVEMGLSQGFLTISDFFANIF